VPAASNEIPTFQPLEGLDLAGVVVTADALHAQRDHASFLVDRGAEDLLVVKANQPALPDRSTAVPRQRFAIDLLSPLPGVRSSRKSHR